MYGMINGEQYLDLYGGHAVISIGHTHPHWVKRIEEQLEKIAFYSNSVKIPLQQQLLRNLEKFQAKKITSFSCVTVAQKPMKMH